MERCSLGVCTSVSIRLCGVEKEGKWPFEWREAKHRQFDSFSILQTPSHIIIQPTGSRRFFSPLFNKKILKCFSLSIFGGGTGGGTKFAVFTSSIHHPSIGKGTKKSRNYIRDASPPSISLLFFSGTRLPRKLALTATEAKGDLELNETALTPISRYNNSTLRWLNSAVRKDLQSCFISLPFKWDKKKKPF